MMTPKLKKKKLKQIKGFVVFTNSTMTELNQHLATVKNIASQIYKQMGKRVPLLPPPTDKYYHIHLDDNQKHNSKITYPPILISKDFTSIQTNVGMLSTQPTIIDSHVINKLEKSLHLKEYNNKYYYVDTDESMKSLDNYYSPRFIEEEWSLL